jgi:hypothetical protein
MYELIMKGVTSTNTVTGSCKAWRGASPVQGEPRGLTPSVLYIPWFQSVATNDFLAQKKEHG